MVYSNQQQYYDVLAQSGAPADCGTFVDFMLEEIFNTLSAYKRGNIATETIDEKSKDKVLELIAANPTITQEQLAAQLRLSRSGIEKIIRQLKAENALARVGGKKDGKWEVVSGSGKCK